MKVLIYGDFDTLQLAASYLRAFQQLGHTVVPFDVRRSQGELRPWLSNRWAHRATITSLRLRRWGASAWNDSLLSETRRTRPDLALIFNGHFIMPETLRAIRGSGARLFILHADNPFRPFLNARPEGLECAVEADCYFIWSRTLENRLAEIGVRRVEYLPFAWDPEAFPHIGLSAEPVNDVVFVGSWDPEREHWLEPIARHFNLKIWGPPYWRTRSRSGSCVSIAWQGRAVRGREAAEIMAKSRVVLNILRRQNMPDGTVMRTFETPGVGAFGLSTRTAGAEQILAEGVAGAYFGTIEECCSQLQNLLPGEGTRSLLAANAHEIVRRGHTYFDRARQMVDIYDRL
ncbi:MAG: CgeB family protein [Chloroflexota bacterium]|nr:MAG: hypothetical protein DLM70_08765 [Chloroflexota bacterium]